VALKFVVGAALLVLLAWYLSRRDAGPADPDE
jgi:hypothetical protein